MKKNTVKGIFAALLIAASLSSYAQTPAQRKLISKHYDHAKLNAMAENFNKIYTENRAKAYGMAVEKGWNVRFTDANGSLNELQGVTEDGVPIYARTLNQGSAITSGAINLNSGGSLGLDLNGTDMLLGLWDGGHPLRTHVDFSNRATNYDGTTEVELHPTHVLGTMIGSGSGNIRARGMAYEATAFDSDWDNDISEMTYQAVNYSLLMSNHSYTITPQWPDGMPTYYYGSYNSWALRMDTLLSTADYYQPVVAAGNDRGGDLNPTKNGNDLLYCYATSKNAIVVAAVYEVLDYASSASVQMSSFSSFGPTDDFRIKPDISAKGVDVFSTSNGSNNRSYTTLQGTSMATPSVTGVVALLQQHYTNLYADLGLEMPFLKAASVRALVIHTAKEAGPTDGPDHMFGWGLINAVGAAEAITNNETSSIVSERNLVSGTTHTQNIYATGTEPLKVTIAWTDPAGVETTTLDPATPRLRNDLDVRVFRNGVEYFPWALTKNWNNLAPSRTDNNVDNVEKIEIATPEAGSYTVVVTNKGTLIGGNQDFSLIVTGIDYAAAGTESEAMSLFSVWPNPSHNELNVLLTSGAESGANVKIYDIQGRVMLEQKLAAKETKLNTSNLSAGIYIVNITNGNKTEVKRIIVK